MDYFDQKDFDHLSDKLEELESKFLGTNLAVVLAKNILELDEQNRLLREELRKVREELHSLANRKNRSSSAKL